MRYTNRLGHQLHFQHHHRHYQPSCVRLSLMVVLSTSSSISNQPPLPHLAHLKQRHHLCFLVVPLPIRMNINLVCRICNESIIVSYCLQNAMTYAHKNSPASVPMSTTAYHQHRHNRNYHNGATAHLSYLQHPTPPASPPHVPAIAMHRICNTTAIPSHIVPLMDAVLVQMFMPLYQRHPSPIPLTHFLQTPSSSSLSIVDHCHYHLGENSLCVS